MTKTYTSKIGLEFVVPLILVFGTVSIQYLSTHAGWKILIILLPVVLFVVHMFLTTNYKIEGNTLIIKSGFLFLKTIDINSIKKIKETNNPLSAPATSIDRLEITYGKFDSILISPKLKKEFIDHILSINPNVEVRVKMK